MTMGMMQAYRHAVQKFSGLKMPTNEAMQHWLEKILPTLPPRMQQMFVDEVFFLSTGLPPTYADGAPAHQPKTNRAPRGNTTRMRTNPRATQEAFDIQQQVCEVLGSEDAATAWLTRKHRVLNYKSPLSVLGTTTGNARVGRLLKRIKRSSLP